jgi:DDB1- and CUL4-associated factor 15
MRDEQEEQVNRQDILCIKCNMTIHTKYRMSDSGPKFNPKYNLNCPGYIIMTENSFIHILHIDLEMNKAKKQGSNVISHKYVGNYLKQTDSKRKRTEVKKPVCVATSNQTTLPVASERKMSIVDEIIADFAEYEIETVDTKCSPIGGQASKLPAKEADDFDELVITCAGGSINFSGE